MVIKNSIDQMNVKADVPATIAEASGLLHAGEYEELTKILIANPPLVSRLQKMADHQDLRAFKAMAFYRWRRFGIHPYTGAELGPQSGPFPGEETE